MAKLTNVKRGDIVRTWFESNCGKNQQFSILYGRVEQAGPRACLIRWESDLTNRIRYAEPKGVELLTREENRDLYDDAVTTLLRRIGPLKGKP